MPRRTALKWTVALGASLFVPAVLAEKVYTVRKDDTLSSIAEDHGVTVKRLATYNKIEKPDSIRIGQRIKIPSGQEAPDLPSEVQSSMDKARVRSGRWKYIVIHHSATDMGTAKGMDAFHRNERHMENGLAYHFVIGNGHGMNDGEVAIGRRWNEQLDGGHLHSEFLNSKSLGICLVGNFDESKPSEKQIDSLHALVASLLKRCKLPVSAVKTHQQIHKLNHDRFTLCPGKHFPIDDLLKRLKE